MPPSCLIYAFLISRTLLLTTTPPGKVQDYQDYYPQRTEYSQSDKESPHAAEEADQRVPGTLGDSAGTPTRKDGNVVFSRISL